jgi:hypothetical protein
MDLTSEKSTLIKQLENVNDLSLIIALKKLLDYSTEKPSLKNDALLEATIQNGLEDFKNKLLRPHKEVIEKIKSRYV